jgi:hypothetical protein
MTKHIMAEFSGAFNNFLNRYKLYTIEEHKLDVIDDEDIINERKKIIFDSLLNNTYIDVILT